MVQQLLRNSSLNSTVASSSSNGSREPDKMSHYYKTKIIKRADFIHLEHQQNKLKYDVNSKLYKIDQDISKLQQKIKCLEKEKIKIKQNYEKDKMKLIKKTIFGK
jgi:hypothetical protein